MGMGLGKLEVKQREGGRERKMEGEKEGDELHLVTLDVNLYSDQSLFL